MCSSVKCSPRSTLPSFCKRVHTHRVPKYTSRAVLRNTVGRKGCSSTFMRLAARLTALSVLAQAVSSWSVKPRRTPSRRCRGAEVYGHATGAMHDGKYTAPPPLPPSSPAYVFADRRATSISSRTVTSIPPLFYAGYLLRGGIIYRTYGTHTNLYIYTFLLTISGPIYYTIPVIVPIDCFTLDT